MPDDADPTDDPPAIPWLREPYDPEGKYPAPPSPRPTRKPTHHARRIGAAMTPLLVLALWLAIAPFQAAGSAFNCGSPVLQPWGTSNLTDRQSDKIDNNCPASAGIRIAQGVVLATLALGAIAIASFFDSETRHHP